jgi:hypothetical protein
VIDREGFPESELQVTAQTEDGTIMAVRHKRMPHIQVCSVITVCKTERWVARAICSWDASVQRELQEQCSFAGSSRCMHF